MSEVFGSGRIIDIALVLMAVEVLALAGVRKRRGRGVPTGELLITLASGAALMLAVRAALVGASWVVVAACMSAGLVAHVVDLGLRWRPTRSGADGHASDT